MVQKVMDMLLSALDRPAGSARSMARSLQGKVQLLNAALRADEAGAVIEDPHLPHHRLAMCELGRQGKGPAQGVLCDRGGLYM